MIGIPAFWTSGDCATASLLETDPKMVATDLSAIAVVVTWAAVAGVLLVSTFERVSVVLPRNFWALISFTARS